MIILVMGVSGSGKSTIGKMLAEKLKWQFQDADDFHSQDNIEKMKRGIPLTDKDRTPWLHTIQQAIKNWLEEKRNVVLACSALKESYREELCYSHEQVHFVYLEGSYELVKDRIRNRKDHFMNESLLKSQFETLEEPVEGIHVNIAHSPEAIVNEIVSRLDIEF